MRWISLFLSGVDILYSQPNFNAATTRPFTLRALEAEPLETEYHRLLVSSESRSFIFPRACISPVDSSRICGGDSSSNNGTGWHFTHDPSLNLLRLSPIGGVEYRYDSENAEAFQAGLLSSGFTGPLSFFLDARMFTELHENVSHDSFDREFVERQSEKASESFAFSSYSRYRANVALNFAWARVAAGRDALHWGPGQFQNLVFHQNAIPFYSLNLESRIGPLYVTSVYAMLSIDGGVNFRTNSDSRSMYAHRYEWNITSDLLLGISEQLIFYNTEEPFSFIPVVPLFIAKGNGQERNNNGNIAFDVSYKFKNSVHLYTEFLIDDLIAPSALFNDYWGNKWAWMAGLHAVHSFARIQSGWIAEYGRIEPWVYTHYQSNTAQSGNQGYPLGNPAGPNSQTLVQKIYIRNQELWYGSLKMELLWKGTDVGSGLNDSLTNAAETSPKKFIYGIGSPDFYATPYLRRRVWSKMFLEGEVRIGKEWSAVARIQVWY